MQHSENEQEDVWCAIASVVLERFYGPRGQELRRGIKHFRGGAKLYVIAAYLPPHDSVTVVGHHRKTGRLITIDIRAKYLENFKVGLVYSPTVKRVILERFSDLRGFSTKEHAQMLCEMLPKWNAHESL